LLAAVAEFERAVKSDPNYASAYVGLADAYNVLGGYGLVPPDEVFPKGEAAAEKALEISPNFSDAYSSIGFAHFYYDWDWAAAEASFRKALALNPNNAVAHLFFASFLHATGRLPEAEVENKIGRGLDPKSSWGYDDHGWMLLTEHKPAEAIAEFQRSLALNPEFAAGHLSLAVAYLRNKQFPEAIEETRKAETLHGDPTRVLEVLGEAQALSGDVKGAESTLDRLLNNDIGGKVSPYSVALIYTSLGFKDRAMDWLEKGYREKEPWLPWLRVLVEWDPLRTEPRFAALLQRMKL
jgi:serine/threonine-protein kinase